MAKGEVTRLAEQFSKRIAALEANAAAEMVSAYGSIWNTLSQELDILLEQIQGQQMSFAQVQKNKRYRQLLANAQEQVNRFSVTAEGGIIQTQRQASLLSQSSTKSVVDAALPSGIDTKVLAQAGIEWVRLPTQALESFVGMAGDGSPLANLLAPLGQEASIGVREGIREGIALGRGPRETARLVRQKFGMPLTRSLAISRTETLRAFRESSRIQYAANSAVVKGWERHSAKDAEVCIACLALDGKKYETQQPIDEHINGRCAMLPVTITYEDLGLDVPETQERVETGREWFENQPNSVQRQMMGRSRYDAWKSGVLDMEDMVHINHSVAWGDTAVVGTLAQTLSP